MANQFRSPIFELSDDYVSQSAALSPISATSLGISGYNHQLDDFSLAGTQRAADLTKRTLGALSMLDPIDEVDQIAKADLAILRLAIYELMIERQEPPKVIINEAVDLAKEMGSDRSFAFVNAVLGAIVSADSNNIQSQ